MNIPYILNHIKANHGELSDVTDSLLELYYELSAQCSVDMSYVMSHPPGHFYSPLPSVDEVSRVAPRVWGPLPEGLPGIDLRVREQQKLFVKFLKHYQEMPFSEQKQDGFRYFFDNIYFCHADAVVLYCMMREFKPKRIIEVGSGFSSAAMLDTDEYFQRKTTKFTFIEPYPERLLKNITQEDASRVTILEKFVQDVDISIFKELKENDILFLDCSHVGKIGSDLLFLLFEVLPNLSNGVFIHFHDIFYPFEYPREWVEKNKWAWNENYFLRAFLLYNESFVVTYFNNYLGKMHKCMLEKYMPVALRNIGGSLWIRKESVSL